MGFADDIRKFTEKVQKQVENLPKRASLPELMNDQFMRAHAKVGTIEELIQKSGLDLDRDGIDFLKMDSQEPKWEAAVREFTDFGSWREMLTAAQGALLKRHLGK